MAVASLYLGGIPFGGATDKREHRRVFWKRACGTCRRGYDIAHFPAGVFLAGDGSLPVICLRPLMGWVGRSRPGSSRLLPEMT